MSNPAFRALIFDMDGTLTLPTMDFAAIRRETGLLSGDLVTEINRLPAADQPRAWDIIRRHERDAMRNQTLQPGATELLARCRRDRLRTGVVTRNELASVDHLCARYGLAFDLVIARDFGFVKPHPAPVVHMLHIWDIAPARALLIGDYVHDIDCGRAAGTRTCFFQNPDAPFHGQDADFTAHSMADLERIVWPAA